VHYFLIFVTDGITLDNEIETLRNCSFANRTNDSNSSAPHVDSEDSEDFLMNVSETSHKTTTITKYGQMESVVYVRLYPSVEVRMYMCR
jgi:hypothetical protein